MARSASARLATSSERYRAAHRSRALVLAFCAVLLLAVELACQPLREQVAEAERLSAQASSVASVVTTEEAEAMAAAARAYNDRIAADGQPMLGESPSFDGNGSSVSEADAEYQGLLDADGRGHMGSVCYPRLGIDLPVAHGTSTEVLETGAGHLYGSSLPVGGEGTKSVISAHRGMMEAPMFTRLGEAREGDLFYVRAPGRVLAYRVCSIEVVGPDDVSRLFVEEGRDLVTLVTCTPLGINTERLLVTGERAQMPEEAPYLSDAAMDEARGRALAAIWSVRAAAVALSASVLWRKVLRPTADEAARKAAYRRFGERWRR